MRKKFTLSMCVLLATLNSLPLQAFAAEQEVVDEVKSNLGRFYLSPDTNIRYQETLTETVVNVEAESLEVKDSSEKGSESIPDNSTKKINLDLEVGAEKESILDVSAKPLDETALPSDFSGYVSINKDVIFNGEIWYQISNNGVNVGYILASEALPNPYLEFSNEVKLEGSFGTILADTVVYSSFDGMKDENVEEVGTVLTNQNVTVLTTVNVDSIVNEEDPKAVYISYKGIEGWVQETDLNEGKFKSDKVKLFDQPYFTEEATVIRNLKDVLGEKPKVIDEAKPENTSVPYVKISLDGKTGYVPATNINVRKYGVLTAEKAITDRVKINEEVSATTKIYDLPNHLETTKVLSETAGYLNNQPLVATIEKTVNFEGADYTYYYVTQDGTGIGWIESNALRIYKLTSESETITETNTVDMVLKRYGLTIEYLKEQNPTINFDTPWNELIYLAPDEVTYVEPIDLPYGISETTKNLIQDLSGYRRILLQEGLYPSVMIAQAMLESSYGTSKLAVNDFNLFGVKGTYNGVGANYNTQEDAGGGNMYTIQATFRKYPSYKESVLDYIDLIVNSGIYQATGKASAKESLQAIKDGGYATDSSYVAKVMSVIDDFDLTQFDK